MPVIDSLKRKYESVAGVLRAVGAWCGRNSVIVVLTVVVCLIAGAAYVGWPLITHGTSQALAAYDAISDNKEKVDLPWKSGEPLALGYAAASNAQGLL